MGYHRGHGWGHQQQRGEVHHHLGILEVLHHYLLGAGERGFLAGVAGAPVLARGEENIGLNIETFHAIFEGNPARLPRGACTAGSHVGAPLKTTVRLRTQAPYKTDQ